MPAVSRVLALTALAGLAAAARWRNSSSACSRLLPGSGPTFGVGSPDDFQQDSRLSFHSFGAEAPYGYGEYLMIWSQIFREPAEMSTSSNGSFIGVRELNEYDASACADLCDQISDCSVINVYFQRSPSVVPGPKCPNPDPTTRIMCSMWRALPTSTDRFAGGYFLEEFYVDMAGSNAYYKLNKINKTDIRPITFHLIDPTSRPTSHVPHIGMPFLIPSFSAVTTTATVTTTVSVVASQSPSLGDGWGFVSSSQEDTTTRKHDISTTRPRLPRSAVIVATTGPVTTSVTAAQSQSSSNSEWIDDFLPEWDDILSDLEDVLSELEDILPDEELKLDQKHAMSTTVPKSTRSAISADITIGAGYEATAYADGNIIRAPLDCNGKNTYLGVKRFVDGKFDAGRCVEVCRQDEGCRFVNTWTLRRNGKTLEQHCALYSKVWPKKFLTPARDEDLHVEATDSYGFTIDDGQDHRACVPDNV